MKTFTLVAALVLAPAAYAQDASKPTDTKTDTSKTDMEKPADTAKPAKAAKFSQSELQVLAHFHAVNQMEIDLAKAAAKLSKSDGVKAYGKMLLKDHSDSDKTLAALAKKRGQKIPAEKPASDVEKQEKADAKAAVIKLKKLKGADFDTAFLSQVIADHERELAAIDAKVEEVQDSELADAIRAVKPVFKQHADQARELQTSINQTSMAEPKAEPKTDAKKK